MATEVIHSIRASGGDYTSIEAWEAAQQRDLVTLDEVAVAEVYDDWPSGLATVASIAGWVTDATRYIEIRAASGHGHDGDVNSGALITNSGATSAFIISLNNVHFTNLRFAVGWIAIQASVVQRIVIDGCFFFSNAAAPPSAFVNKMENAEITNCGFFNKHADAVTTPAGIGIGNRSWVGGSGWTYNCTFQNLDVGQSGGWSGRKIKNCAFYNCTTEHATVGVNIDYNATSNSVGASSLGGANDIYDVASGDFVDVSNHDLHLAQGSALIGVGVDLSSALTTDIDGDTRSSWDIGFDEYVSLALDVVQFNFWNIGSIISTPWFNSSPTLGAIYAYLGTGGSVSVGLAALNYSAFYIGIGGGKGTGQALIEYIASYVANGGSFSSGQVLYNLIAQTLGQGGSYSTGAVTTTGSFAPEGEGGAASTGQTTFNSESYLTADGGSASSGQAEYNYDVKLYGIGGSTSSGVAGRNIIAEISSVGGSASTGSSTIGTVFYSEGQGGATSSGQPDYSISIVPEGQGGSASSGTSTLNINLSYEALGGAASLGTGDYQFLAAAVGFIVQQKPFSAIIEKTGAKEIIVEAKGIQNFIIEKK